MVDYYIGIIHYAQKEIGTFESLIMGLSGKKVEKDSCWGNVYGLEKSINISAPFDCKILLACRAEDLKNIPLKIRSDYVDFSVIYILFTANYFYCTNSTILQ